MSGDSEISGILATFEEHGMVEKTTFMGDGTVVYELNRGEHTHYAVCLECHKRIPLPSCPFAHVHLEQDTGDCGYSIIAAFVISLNTIVNLHGAEGFGRFLQYLIHAFSLFGPFQSLRVGNIIVFTYYIKKSKKIFNFF